MISQVVDEQSEMRLTASPDHAGDSMVAGRILECAGLTEARAARRIGDRPAVGGGDMLGSVAADLRGEGAAAADGQARRGYEGTASALQARVRTFKNRLR